MKRCSKCGKDKPFADFSKRKAFRDGHRYCCKKCEAKAAQKHYAANKEKILDATRKWQSANPEKLKEANRKWQSANPEKFKEATRKSHAKSVKNLSDSYIKRVLRAGRGIKAKDITHEMIEFKRLSIQYHRHIKLMRREI